MADNYIIRETPPVRLTPAEIDLLLECIGAWHNGIQPTNSRILEANIIEAKLRQALEAAR